MRILHNKSSRQFTLEDLPGKTPDGIETAIDSISVSVSVVGGSNAATGIVLDHLVMPVIVSAFKPAKRAYAPIRKTEGREWIDTGCLGELREIVEEKVSNFARSIPSWDKENPVQRIACIEIREVPE